MAEEKRSSFSDAGWSRMLGMAPSLAERAKKLFRGRSIDGTPPALAPSGAEAVSAIEVRVHSIEKHLGELREEMAASFEVVSAITDQHSELVRAVDVVLARTRHLQRICVGLGVGVGIALAALVLLAILR